MTLSPADAHVPVVDFDGVSKWYGNVIGLNKLTVSVPPGITGLLGPNGAGKSTFLQLATGQLKPSQGSVRVLGVRPWDNPELNRRIGLCPEQDAFYEGMTGRQFLTFCGRMSGMGPKTARRPAEATMERVGLTEQMNRAIRGYSKGMRQRTKLAQALVHDPDVLFLDEPFSGTDPVVRHELVQIVLKIAAEGKGILISSHVLYEVQSITSNIILINRGRLVAEGDMRQIRELIDTHPHRIVLKSPTGRAWPRDSWRTPTWWVSSFAIRMGRCWSKPANPIRSTAAFRRFRSMATRPSTRFTPTTTALRPSSAIWCRHEHIPASCGRLSIVATDGACHATQHFWRAGAVWAVGS